MRATAMLFSMAAVLRGASCGRLRLPLQRLGTGAATEGPLPGSAAFVLVAPPSPCRRRRRLVRPRPPSHAIPAATITMAAPGTRVGVRAAAAAAAADATTADVEAQTLEWVQRMVIGLGLCPWAAGALTSGALRIRATPTTSLADLGALIEASRGR